MPPTNNQQETVVWQGNPSYSSGAVIFIPCILFSWLIIPMVVGIIEWLRIKNTHYQLTTERLLISSGIFSKKIEQIELYRIRDIVVEIPLIFRIFNIANIKIISTDRSTPEILITGIINYINLKESIREYVEKLRESKRRIF